MYEPCTDASRKKNHRQVKKRKYKKIANFTSSHAVSVVNAVAPAKSF